MATGGDTVNITNAYEDSRLANDVEYSFFWQELKIQTNQMSLDLLSISQFVSISSNARKDGFRIENLSHFYQFWMGIKVLGRMQKENSI